MEFPYDSLVVRLNSVQHLLDSLAGLERMVVDRWVREKAKKKAERDVGALLWRSQRGLRSWLDGLQGFSRGVSAEGVEGEAVRGSEISVTLARRGTTTTRWEHCVGIWLCRNESAEPVLYCSAVLSVPQVGRRPPQVCQGTGRQGSLRLDCGAV
jgi:hypothetical protein